MRSHVESINAVTLAVSDMARSHLFYEALAFETVSGGAEAAFTTLRCGESFLNLQLDRDHAPLPHIWGRVIFWVDDVDAVFARATAADLSPSTEPADAPWGERYFHLRDPDGHELSFARPLLAHPTLAPTDVGEMMGAFRAAITSGDADRMASLYTPDAVYYLPALGIAVRGRPAIRAQWAATFEAWRALDFVVDDHQLDVHDHLASSWLRARLLVEWHDSRRREELPVRAADVFRREADGRWRYAVDHA